MFIPLWQISPPEEGKVWVRLNISALELNDDITLNISSDDPNVKTDAFIIDIPSKPPKGPANITKDYDIRVACVERQSSIHLLP